MESKDVQSVEEEKQRRREQRRRIEPPSPDSDQDEEARLRARLLARRTGKGEIESTKSSQMSKKVEKHHKKKRKRRSNESVNEEERMDDDFVEDVSITKGVHTSATAARRHHEEEVEEGLNIQPPRNTSSLSASSSSHHQHKRHKKKSKTEAEYDVVYIESKYRGYEREHSPNKDKRVAESWLMWKRNLVTETRAPPREHKQQYFASERDRREHSEKLSGERFRGVVPFEDKTKTHGQDYFHRHDRRFIHEHRSRSPHSRGISSEHQKFAEPRHEQQARWLPKVKKDSSRSSSVTKSEGNTTSTSTKEKSSGLSRSAKSGAPVTPDEVPLEERKPTVSTPTMDEVEDKEPVKTEAISEVSKSGSSGSGSSSSGSASDTEEGGDSLEDGERRSENGEEKPPIKSKTKEKYSKFESSSDEESSSEEDRRRNDEDEENEKKNGENMDEAENIDSDDDAGETKRKADSTEPISPEPEAVEIVPDLPIYFPAIMGCRSVEEFHCMNRIEEGTYGVVYRAQEKRTNEIVALKRLKMEKEKEGFPITSLREINMLLKAADHPNIVNVREIVVGSNMDKIYLVMDYVEHDLKSLMETMKQPFLVGEVKTLMRQLLSGVYHLHDNWILHRDLKTSNLLLSHKGILKIGDFGLAREYGSPLKPYTPIVVTLWYRAPELLLGIKEYSTSIDVWSVGCIFAELLTLKPIFTGKSEIEQLNRIFKMLGTPNNKIWEGYDELPGVQKMSFVDYPYNSLRKHFGATLSDKGFQLLNKLLTYDPVKRISCKDALNDLWFDEEPRPVCPDMFPTWPAKSELSKMARKSSPKPPSGGKQFKQTNESEDDLIRRMNRQANSAVGFSLKFDAPKF